jgi:multiple sugar transport system substrate-binding protein
MFKKEMNRRDFLKLSTIAAGTTALAACGGQAAKPTESTSGGAAAPAGEQITLVQYYHEYGEKGCAEASKRYADEYTTVKSNVKVDRQWIPGDYAQKLNSALLTDQAPDVWESGPDAARYKAGLCADLTDTYAGVQDDFNPRVIQASSWQGKIMGIRMIIDTGMIYCRKSIFDAAGVKPPTTLAEVVDTAKKLTTDKQKGLFLGNDGIGGVADQSVYASGVKSLVENNKVAFNTDRAAEALLTIKKLNDDGSVLLGAPTDWWDPSTLTQGLAAMQWCGLWAMPGIREVIQDDFYVVPWPKMDDQGTPSTFLGGWTSFVSAKGKHVDEAKAFNKWLWIENKKDQEDWSLSYGFHIPPRKSTAAGAEKLKTGPAKEAWDNVDKYGHDESPFFTGAMWTAFGNAVANIVKNGANPKTELDTAAKTCQDELDKVLA